MQTIRKGLMNEAHRKPAHQPHYIEWALAAIEMRLRSFNEQRTSAEAEAEASGNL